MNRVFYIGGKAYDTATATKLCGNEQSDFALFDTTTLYRTAKGAFFTVTDEIGKKPTARVLTEREAQAFMDANTGGIDRAAYIAVFGEPEQA